MSLINDALKRAKAAQEQSPPPPVSAEISGNLSYI